MKRSVKFVFFLNSKINANNYVRIKCFLRLSIIDQLKCVKINGMNILGFLFVVRLRLVNSKGV